MDAILASAMVVDTATVGVLQASGTGGERVREWYRTLRIGAYTMDVLSMACGVFVAMLIAPQSLWAQLGLVVAIQMTHDLLFGAFVMSPYAKGPLMSLFRRYAQGGGANILWVDALMMVATVLVARQLSGLSTSAVRFVGALAAYVGMLLVYSF